MKRLKMVDAKGNGSRILPALFGAKKITGGGLSIFKPGEIPHPEPHAHDCDEVFIFLQGRGILPIDGKNHPIGAGDVIIVEKGEDHHTTSSVEDPLVAAWYLMEK